MIIEMDVHLLLVKLERLRSLDPAREVFGASAHRYELSGPIEEARLRHDEASLGIVLPDDYRAFLLQMGNGGAGPFYGIFAWHWWDGPGDGEEWVEDDGNIGRLREPFPHREAWEPPEWSRDPPEEFGTDDEEDAWYAAADAVRYDTALVNGAFPIVHHGCALRTWLVVTGAERGNVWYDARASRGGLAPHATEEKPRLTFAEWYEAWLDRSIRELGG